MLFKSIAIILSTLLLAAVQISTANAGCGGGHGGYRSAQKSVHQKQALRQSQARKARAVAVAKQKKSLAAAETTKTVAAEQAPVAADDAAAADTPVTVAASPQTCTKFIAATGTTVAVECSAE